MRIIGRFFLALYELILAIFSIIIIALISFLWTERITYEMIGNQVQYYFSYPLAYPIAIGVFGLISIISLAMVFSGGSRKEERKPITIDTESGQISISLETFESIAGSALKKISDAKDFNIKVKNINSSINASIKIFVAQEVNIPELCKTIQAKTIETIETITGIKVQTVKVKVENIYAGIKSKVE